MGNNRNISLEKDCKIQARFKTILRCLPIVLILCIAIAMCLNLLASLEILSFLLVDKKTLFDVITGIISNSSTSTSQSHLLYHSQRPMQTFLDRD